MTRRPEYQPSEALLAAALEMFGNEAAARRWLAQPRPTLGGLSPLEFAHTQPDGEQYIINLLDRTAYGAYS